MFFSLLDETMKWMVFQATILHFQGYTGSGITKANEINFAMN